MTSGISDIGARLSQQYTLKILREQLNTAQLQASTGKKSQTLAGLGPAGASQSISLRGKMNVIDVYTNNLNTAKTRFQIMDASLTSINDDARDFLSTLREQLQSGMPKATILSETGKANLQSIVDKLNTQFNGRHLFAGDDITGKPINNVAALNTSMATLGAAWLAGAPTVSSVTADVSAVTGTGLGMSTSAILAGDVSMRVDDNTDIDMTLKVTQSGFSDILRGIAMIVNLPQPTTTAEQNNYWTVVNSAIALIESGTSAVDQSQGAIGARAKIVDNLLVQHKETQSVYETFIGDVEDVDAAESAIKFQALQTQLETSYTIIGSLRNLTLANFI